jgi:hypothetical protein
MGSGRGSPQSPTRLRTAADDPVFRRRMDFLVDCLYNGHTNIRMQVRMP